MMDVGNNLDLGNCKGSRSETKDLRTNVQNDMFASLSVSFDTAYNLYQNKAINLVILSDYIPELREVTIEFIQDFEALKCILRGIEATVFNGQTFKRKDTWLTISNAIDKAKASRARLMISYCRSKGLGERHEQQEQV